MAFVIRKLTPNLAHDYVRFFDTTPHDDNADAHKCYCVCWCSDDFAGKDFSTAKKRRECAWQYVKGGKIQGYLAYVGDSVVGWCNANTKSDCLQCASWQRFMGHVPLDQPGIQVKSVFCFVIAPHWQRKGLATQLLERVCQDAFQDGFDIVEAYPYQESSGQSSDFGGYVEMYERSGFQLSLRTEKGLVVRKHLK